MALQDLSVELIEAVGNFIPRKDLLNLALASKWLFTVLESVLCHDYILPPDRATSHEHPLGGRRLPALIHKLIDRPALAYHFHKLTLLDWTCTCGQAGGHMTEEELFKFGDAAKRLGLLKPSASFSFCFPRDTSSPTGDVNQLTENILNDANTPEDREWITHVYNGCDEALLVLLLALVPRLEHLNMKILPLKTHSWGYLSHANHGFCKLSHLSFSKTGYRLPLLLGFINAIATDIKILHIMDTARNYLGMALQWPRAEMLASITDLSLTGSDIDFGFVISIIGRCKSLKAFYYQMDYNREWNPLALVDALLPHKQTLSYLSIMSQGRNSYYLPKLAEFDRLAVLAIPTCLMGGPPVGRWHDVLPRSLEAMLLHGLPFRSLFNGNEGQDFRAENLDGSLMQFADVIRTEPFPSFYHIVLQGLHISTTVVDAFMTADCRLTYLGGGWNKRETRTCFESMMAAHR